MTATVDKSKNSSHSLRYGFVDNNPINAVERHIEHGAETARPACDLAGKVIHKNSLEYVGDMHVYGIKVPNG